MELAPDAVTREDADHRVAGILGVSLHDVADVRETFSRRHGLDREVETLSGHVEQALLLGVDPADGDGDRRVAVEAVEGDPEVQTDDVPIVEDVRTGDPVDNFRR